MRWTAIRSCSRLFKYKFAFIVLYADIVSAIASSLESIIAFVNPKSGGQKGRIVLERLKNYLHKDNVFDLTKGGPKPGQVFF